MPKIKTVIALGSLPVGKLSTVDAQLNDLIYGRDFGDIDELENYLTGTPFIIVSTGKGNIWVLDYTADDLDLADYDLTDPKGLISEDASSFTINQWADLFSGLVSIKTVREQITGFLEMPVQLQNFGEVSING